jgi:hypothetical protein
MPVLIDRWLVVTLKGYQFDQQFENVLAYRYADTDPRPDEAVLNAQASAFWAAVGTNVRALVPPLTYFSEVVVEDRTPSNRIQGHYLIPTPNAGTQAGDINTFNQSECISFKTGEIYKGGHGRCYLGATAEGATLNGLFTAAYFAAVAVYAASLASFHGTGTLHLLHAVARQTAAKLRNVTSYSWDYIPDSQRRRLQGRGR